MNRRKFLKGLGASLAAIGLGLGFGMKDWEAGIVNSDYPLGAFDQYRLEQAKVFGRKQDDIMMDYIRELAAIPSGDFRDLTPRQQQMVTGAFGVTDPWT